MKLLTSFFKESRIGMLVLLSGICYHPVSAQLKPVNALYYLNDYIINPAMAGMEPLVNASIGYRAQLTSIPGAPQSQYLTADYGFAGNSGVGIKLYNDKAGLLRQTALAVTYAYHLPISEEQELHFGISGTFTNYGLNTADIRGDAGDQEAMDVNQRNTYIDSDFGVTYTASRFKLQFVFPNMITALTKGRENQADYALFFSSVSYGFNTQIGVFAPLVAFRGVKGFDHIIDAGATLALKSTTQNSLNLIAMYHSSKNATFGFGVTFNKKYGINSSYTMGASQIRSQTIGDLEVGLSLKL